jgi:glycosyltransferase 2 family protein
MTALRARTRALPRRSLLIGTALGIPFSIAFLLLASRNIDPGSVRAALRGADARLLVPAVLLMLLMYCVQAYRWRWITQRDTPVAMSTSLRYLFGGLACNNAIPGRPGDILRAQWLHAATGMGRSNALATVVVDRSFDVLALAGALAVSSPLVAHDADWLRRLDLAAGAVATLIVAVLVAAWFFARRTQAHHVAAPSLVARVTRKLTVGVGSRVGARDSVVLAGMSTLVWTLWAASAWCVATALGLGLSPAELLFVTAVVNLGVAIPSSPGFIGTYQWLCVSSFGLLAIGRSEAFAFSVLMHAVWFVPTSLAGLALLGRALPSLLASRRRSAEVEPRAA